MKNVFIITEINNDTIMVSQLNENENKQTVSHLQVLNPKNYKIETGTKVHVGFSKEMEAITGILSLFLPIAISFIGLHFSSSIASILNIEPTENIRFAISITFFIAAVIIDYILTRKIKTIVKPRITKVLD